MNCATCRQWVSDHAGADLAPEVAEHLLACEACRKDHRRQVGVRQLLRIKQFEQPDPHLETRLMAAVAAGIREADARPRGWQALLTGWLGAGVTPAWRAALTCLILSFIGLNWLAGRSLPPLPTASIEAVRPVQPTPWKPVASPMPGLLESRWAVRQELPPGLTWASTQGPMRSSGSGAQYGSGPSRLAGFEY